MTTDTKPRPEGTEKSLRCPGHVHALILELRQLMIEQRHEAYWKGAHGKVMHGSIADAPKHLVVQWALRIAIEILHPDREQFAAAHEAREAYLASFEEEDTE